PWLICHANIIPCLEVVAIHQETPKNGTSPPKCSFVHARPPPIHEMCKVLFDHFGSRPVVRGWQVRWRHVLAFAFRCGSPLNRASGRLVGQPAVPSGHCATFCADVDCGPGLVTGRLRPEGPILRPIGHVRRLARPCHLSPTTVHRPFAPPASQNANLGPLVEGDPITLAARHAKARREDYARCIGTMTVRPPLRSFTWLPRWLTHETGLGQSSDDLGTADDRQRRAHAESWTVAIIGGSMASGRASSSKYSSSASRRLAGASSVVRPWLVTSTSRSRATYHPSSCVTAAVNCTITTLRRRGSRRGRRRLTKSLFSKRTQLYTMRTFGPSWPGRQLSW